MSCSYKKYDVFISFRGEDTRVTFTSNLHSALENKNIRTYIDYQLSKGADVWPALSSAIESSHMSLVVFSKKYASSKWCLQELVKIMECRKNEEQIVIPVFYEINPSHVRRQRGSYQKAFAQHVRDLDNNESNQDIVRKWRDALREAASICGWDCRSRTHRDDADVIEDIVSDVLQKLYKRYPNDLKGVVGIEKYLEYFELVLKSARKIGIWGMGGIGKTTIAKALFAKLFPQYDNVCFLENIRQNSERNGLSSLHEKLVFELLKDKHPASIDVRATFIMRRLNSKRVFIVLDDVDSYEQLNCLCGQRGDLGENITLIITTRDKELLRERVDKICEVMQWSYEESRELFCLKAFKKRHSQEGYKDLVDTAVHCAGRIPLALEVLGSHLYSRSQAFWESTLNKLEKYPNKDIMKVLKVSYDELDVPQKKIFLDIAFFFNLKRKNDVIKILDACGFYATSGIEVLEDKAMITIGYSDEIQMHDLFIEMGLEIVRKEHENPEKHSRLKGKEAYDVLKNNMGTNAVEGILLDLSQVENLPLRTDTFKRMSKLRFIQLYIPSGERSCVVYNDTILNTFSDELRYLEWNGYPFKSFPPNFCSKFLVEIHMPHSNVKELWQGMQDLMNLEAVDLRECRQLIELPDFSRASKLRQVYLSGCESLLAIHPSLLSVNTLTTLLLDGCQKLKILTTEKHFSFLLRFNVNHCSSLKEFSLSSELIESLDLSNTGVKILHSTIGRLSRLVWLNLEGLRLENLPDELSHLRSLKELRISNCGQVINKQKLHVLCDGTLKSLKVLHLKDCYKLFELPDNISALSSLHELRLDGSSVERLPTSIKHFQKLEILSLENCKKVQSLPELPTCIKEFNAKNCMLLVTVSTLKTFSVQMNGKDKYISFKNGMKLNESSLISIMEDTEYTMLSAAFHNVIVRCFGLVTHSYNYNTVEVCFPGRNVPRFFPYQTTGTSIIIELPSTPFQLIGFIYCVVLSPPQGLEQHGVHIQCKCLRPNDTNYTMVGYTKLGGLKELISDHVFVWYDPFHCDDIIGNYERNVCFEFYVTNENGQHNGLISIKECGVRLIWSSRSEFHNFLREFDLELNSKLKLGLRLDLALEMDRGNYVNSRKLFFALERGEELDESLEQNLESRRQVILKAIQTGSNGIRTSSRSLRKAQDPTLDIVKEEEEDEHTNQDEIPEGKDEEEENKDEEDDHDEEEWRPRKTRHQSQDPTPIDVDASSESNSSDEPPPNQEPQEPLAMQFPEKNKETPKKQIEEPFQQQQFYHSPKKKIADSATTVIQLKGPESKSAPKQSDNPLQIAQRPSSPTTIEEYHQILQDDPLALVNKIISGVIFVSSKSTSAKSSESTSISPVIRLLDRLRYFAFSTDLIQTLQVDPTVYNQLQTLIHEIEAYQTDLTPPQAAGISKFCDWFGSISSAFETINEAEANFLNSQLEHEDLRQRIIVSNQCLEQNKEAVQVKNTRLEAINKEVKELESRLDSLQKEAKLLNETKAKCEEVQTKAINEIKTLSEAVLNLVTSTSAHEK